MRLVTMRHQPPLVTFMMMFMTFIIIVFTIAFAAQTAPNRSMLQSLKSVDAHPPPSTDKLKSTSLEKSGFYTEEVAASDVKPSQESPIHRQHPLLVLVSKKSSDSDAENDTVDQVRTDKQTEDNSKVSHAKDTPESSKSKESFDAGNVSTDGFVTEGPTLTDDNSYYLFDPIKGSGKCKSHSDSFPCPPCNCSHTFGGRIIASCENLRLQSIPRKLPPKTWRLDVRGNALWSFTTNDLFRYPLLNEVLMSFNRYLAKVRRGTEENSTLDVQSLTINACNISSIENKSFLVTQKLRNLSLSANLLTDLTNFTFDGLQNLMVLNLSNNRISNIALATFDPLIHLRILDLSSNRIHSFHEKKLPGRLFFNLKLLRELYIQGNDVSGDSYPNKALAELTNLQTLHIDGHGGKVFGEELKMLEHFKHLEMGEIHNSHMCNIRNLTREFFKNIPYTEIFKIHKCRLHHITSDAFTHAKNLKTLSLSHVPNYDLFTAFSQLKGLQKTDIKSLSLVSLHHSWSLCRSLNYRHGRYLKTLKLEELDLSENLLALLRDDFLRELPTTLKRLILRKNKYDTAGLFLFRITFLNKLIELDISDQNVDRFWVHGTNDHQPGQFQDSKNTTALDRTGNSQGTTTLIPNSTSCQWEMSDEYQHSEAEIGVYVIWDWVSSNEASYEQPRKLSVGKILHLPPKLQIIKASGFNSIGMMLLNIQHQSRSLRKVDFSNGFLSKWGSVEMPPAIEHVNLDNNYCKSIRPGFFKANNSLIYLSIRNNYFGPQFAGDYEGKIFMKLKKTKYLDMSVNLIYHLPRHFFKGLLSVQTLNISNNKLQSLNVSFSHMKHLRYLDLSRNSITWISKNTRDSIDEIATINELNIDLTLNPLPCSCPGLEIFHWLASTNACLENSDFLKCRLESGEFTDIGKIEDRLKTLQQNCASKAVIIVSTVASITLVCILVVLSLMYRYRWKLRYLRNIAMAKWFGFEPAAYNIGAYKFDAYILYSADTRNFVIGTCIPELETKRGCKLCVEDRDFLAGTFAISNIVSAIQNSAKVVLIVTPEFYDDLYSEYSVKMAVMEELCQRRDVLHLCLYKPVDSEEMPRDPLRVLDRGNYTEYPPENEALEEQMMKDFWDSLSQAIGHREANNRM